MIMAIPKVPRLQLVPPNVYLVRREFSVFNDFSKKIKGETPRNPKLQQGFKGVNEDLKVRTNQTTEQLYKNVNGERTEAEAKAKKIVKYSFGMGKQESKLSIGTSGEEKQSPLSKKWEAFMNKMRSHIHTLLKRATDPKQIPAQRRRRLFATSCPPGKMGLCVHGEPEMNMFYKEMRLRDPSFTLPDLLILWEVQKVVKQVLNADFKIAAADMGKFTHHPGNILDLCVSGEPDFVKLFTEMQRRDLTFSSSSPEFHREVEKLVKPIINAHFKKQGVGATRVGEDSSNPKGTNNNESNF